MEYAWCQNAKQHNRSKQTEELAPVSRVPVQARMQGQFHSTCLLMQNIKSFLNPPGEIHSWVVILRETEEITAKWRHRHLGWEAGESH